MATSNDNGPCQGHREAQEVATIRPATEADLPAILAIYNDAGKKLAEQSFTVTRP